MADVEIARLMDRLMRRIHITLNAAASEFDQHQIGPAGGLLLLTLAEHEPMRAQDLSKLMSRDKAQITRGTQALERKGLICRSNCPDDGRVALLNLTEEGHATVAVLEQAVADALSDVLAPLSDDDYRQLKTVLRKL